MKPLKFNPVTNEEEEQEYREIRTGEFTITPLKMYEEVRIAYALRLYYDIILRPLE